MSDEYGATGDQFMARRNFDDGWSVRDMYDTRQEAIDSYADDSGEPDGSHFRTARLVFRRELPPCPFSSDRALEEVTENSEWGETSTEKWCDDATAHTDELDKKLEDVWEKWCEKHNLTLEAYFPEDEESHIVGEDESDAELARRKERDGG